MANTTTGMKSGLSNAIVFGELEFSLNPTWRVSWWLDEKIHRDSGFIEENFRKFIVHIFNDCIPGQKKKELSEKINKINSDFD